jgi:hypothetical protein
MHLVVVLLVGLGVPLVAAVPAVPAIPLRELEWLVPLADGAQCWRPGADLTPFPSSLGRIETARTLGPQELVWKHRYHAIDTALLMDDGTWHVGFARGVLILRHLGGLRWEGTFIPRFHDELGGTFRTRADLVVCSGWGWANP